MFNKSFICFICSRTYLADIELQIFLHIVTPKLVTDSSDAGIASGFIARHGLWARSMLPLRCSVLVVSVVTPGAFHTDKHLRMLKSEFWTPHQMKLRWE